MTEIWKQIPGYEGYYEASDHGRIRSIDREIPWGKRGIRSQKGIFLKFQNSEKDGRFQVSLCARERGKEQTLPVATFIALTFIGPRPEGLSVCHLDGNNRNDHVSNLAYQTHQMNMDDRSRHGTTVLGTRHPKAKLTPTDVQTIRMLNGVYSMTEMAAMFGISHMSVWQVLNGRTWKHVPMLY